MGHRLDLHELLRIVMGDSGKAYFQPPQDASMSYPCIVYTRDDSYVEHADNLTYGRKKRYSVMVIDRNPDSSIVDLVEELPYTRFDRFYIADGLNHTVFQMYF